MTKRTPLPPGAQAFILAMKDAEEALAKDGWTLGPLIGPTCGCAPGLTAKECADDQDRNGLRAFDEGEVCDCVCDHPQLESARSE